ncbi:dihydroorotase [Propylenella binzhouense]|uniref:Dihydroorotase n=1 Tax=Propylenella binzhouense TaxID=2555902 RepID=A0A964WS76_9HYPH|nr:dihydroorotase [Propylenella binzhouense]MYZ46684.1 dihydroorotase [Propylenella binzhouense]
MPDTLPPPLVVEAARIVDPSRGLDAVGSVVALGGRIAAAGPEALNQGIPEGAIRIDGAGRTVVPGLVDMRVFVGEPGGEHRETLATASRAAAAGGVTTLITMPDTDPVIDDPALVDFLLRRARDTAHVHVHPMAALTQGLKGEELSEFGLLKEAGAVAFTEGRRSLRSAQVMRNALTYARDFDALVVHHTEDSDLAAAGVMNEGETATRLGLPGIPREAETIVLDRDLKLARLTGARYHAAQLSCAQSLWSVRRAKEAGLAVTAGAAIAHLALNENDIGAYRTFFKMSPPLRSEDDRRAMVEALADGTLDVVCSAHDPQDVEGKRRPFAEAAPGAVGLETLLAVGLRLVHDGDVGLARLVDAMSTRPARLLGLDAGTLAPGAPADLAIIDLDRPWVVAEEALNSKARNTAFEGARLTGQVIRTVLGGRLVFDLDERRGGAGA